MRSALRKSLLIAMALVLLSLTATSAAWSQQPEKKPQPEKPPPKHRSLIDQLPSSDAPWPDPPDASPPAAPPPGPTPKTSEAAIAAEIARLRRQIAARQTLTSDTITPLPSAKQVLSLMQAYERRLDGMRRGLFIAAPPKFVETVTAFQARWETLGTSIRTGQKPPELDRTTWNRLARGLSGPACATVAQMPAGPVKVDGGRWACLSDHFFREQAELEVVAHGSVGRRREDALAPLTREMESVRKRLEWLRAHATVLGPEEALWRRDMTERLNRAFVEGAKVRLAELLALQTAAGQNPAYRQFLGTLAENVEMRAAARQSSSGVAPRRIRVPADVTIETLLDGARARAVASDVAPAAVLERLARELGAVHHRLRGVEPRVERELHRDLAIYRQDLERADIVSGDADLKDRAKAEARRQALARRAKELMENERPRLIARDSGRLEQIRQNLLGLLASAAN